MLGILPYAGIAFSINEQSRKQLYKIRQRDLTTIEKIQCGGLSGVVAQSITYPLEVTRRRMQTIGVVKGKDAAIDVLDTSVKSKVGQDAAIKVTEEYIATKPPTMFQIIRDVIKEQGIRGFYKGLSMNWVKGPLAFSISFTTFDIVKEWIEELGLSNDS